MEQHLHMQVMNAIEFMSQKLVVSSQLGTSTTYNQPKPQQYRHICVGSHHDMLPTEEGAGI